jgi:hypothetical protein
MPPAVPLTLDATAPHVIEVELNAPHVNALEPQLIVPDDVTEVELSAPHVMLLVPHEIVPLLVIEVELNAPVVAALVPELNVPANDTPAGTTVIMSVAVPADTVPIATTGPTPWFSLPSMYPPYDDAPVPTTNDPRAPDIPETEPVVATPANAVTTSPLLSEVELVDVIALLVVDDVADRAPVVAALVPQLSVPPTVAPVPLITIPPADRATPNSPTATVLDVLPALWYSYVSTPALYVDAAEPTLSVTTPPVPRLGASAFMMLPPDVLDVDDVTSVADSDPHVSAFVPHDIVPLLVMLVELSAPVVAALVPHVNVPVLVMPAQLIVPLLVTEVVDSAPHVMALLPHEIVPDALIAPHVVVPVSVVVPVTSSAANVGLELDPGIWLTSASVPDDAGPVKDSPGPPDVMVLPDEPPSVSVPTVAALVPDEIAPELVMPTADSVPLLVTELELSAPHVSALTPQLIVPLLFRLDELSAPVVAELVPQFMVPLIVAAPELSAPHVIAPTLIVLVPELYAPDDVIPAMDDVPDTVSVVNDGLDPGSWLVSASVPPDAGPVRLTLPPDVSVDPDDPPNVSTPTVALLVPALMDPELVIPAADNVPESVSDEHEIAPVEMLLGLNVPAVSVPLTVRSPSTFESPVTCSVPVVTELVVTLVGLNTPPAIAAACSVPSTVRSPPNVPLPVTCRLPLTMLLPTAALKIGTLVISHRLLSLS